MATNLKQLMFSIILPAFNEESFIITCLNSLAKQTLPENLFEVILINDCSTDQTLEIATTYKKLNNIKIISNKTNKGLGHSRNNGIKKAEGKYIFFLDADDLITEDALEKVYKHINKYQSDIIVFNWAYHYDYNNNNNMIKRNCSFNFIPKNPNDAVEKCLGLQGVDYTNNYKVVKRSLFKKHSLLYPKGYHEDISMTFKLYYLTKNITILDEILYIRTIRNTSITNRFTEKHIDGLLNAWPDMMKFIECNLSFKNYIPTYKKGLSGLIANIVTKIKTKQEIAERIHLYTYLFNRLKNDKYINISYPQDMPQNTKKDKITNIFLNNLNNYKILNEEAIHKIEEELNA